MTMNGFKPLRSRAANTTLIGGMYGATANLTSLDAALAGLTRVPAAIRDRIIDRVAFVICSRAESMSLFGYSLPTFGGAIAVTYSANVATGVNVWTWTGANHLVLVLEPTYDTTLIHELGHVLDWENCRATGAFLRDSTEITDLWAHASAIAATNPDISNDPSPYYGWTNKTEFFAELFRWHMWGYGVGAVSADTIQGDTVIRKLMMGPTAALTGIDDSWATRAHAAIANLTFTTAPR